MTNRDPCGNHPEDLPWNDVPADSDVVPGTEEPDPAEVVGSEDDDAERDEAEHASPDPADKYRRDSLDERLAEEEPDRPERAPAGGLDVVDAAGGDEAEESEPDDDDPAADDRPAEESAMHVTDEP